MRSVSSGEHTGAVVSGASARSGWIIVCRQLVLDDLGLSVGENVLKGCFLHAQLHIDDIAERSHTPTTKIFIHPHQAAETPPADPGSSVCAAVSETAPFVRFRTSSLPAQVPSPCLCLWLLWLLRGWNRKFHVKWLFSLPYFCQNFDSQTLT